MDNSNVDISVFLLSINLRVLPS